MEKQTKITYILFSLATLFVVLHNAFYGFFKVEEPVFFVLALISILAFFISVFKNTFSYIKRGEPKDLWKLGFLGLFGLIGLVTNPGLYGFFGFFGFFGLKRRKNKEQEKQNPKTRQRINEEK